MPTHPPNPDTLMDDEDLIMSSEEPIDGRCNHYPTDEGGYCAKYPANDPDGDGKVEDGKCYRHSDHVGLDPRVPNQRHGLYTQRSSYYQNLSAEKQAWIDLLIEDFLDDAPFDSDHLGNMELLRGVCIDIHKVRGGNDYIQEEGFIEENVVDYDENGEPIVKKVENQAHLPIDRLLRSIIDRLTKMGILDDDPQSKLAENTGDLARIMSQTLEDDSE